MRGKSLKTSIYKSTRCRSCHTVLLSILHASFITW